MLNYVNVNSDTSSKQKRSAAAVRSRTLFFLLVCCVSACSDQRRLFNEFEWRVPLAFAVDRFFCIRKSVPLRNSVQDTITSKHPLIGVYFFCLEDKAQTDVVYISLRGCLRQFENQWVNLSPIDFLDSN